MAKPLPKSKAARSALLLRNSSEYIRRMSQTDVDRLLLALSKTKGLGSGEVRVLYDDFYNVDWEFVPERLKE